MAINTFEQAMFYAERKSDYFAHPEDYRVAPFRIFGNLYYVGDRDACPYLIDTGEGLILIDTGYGHETNFLIENIETLGFRVEDIRIIIHSHGHVDHAAATAALAALTGAETFIGAGDLEMVDGTRPELTWTPEFNMAPPAPFKPDHLLCDGDQIKLGNVVIDCVETPGHTRGVISYFWNVEYQNKVYRAGTFGGAGLKSMKSDYIHKYHLENEDRRAAFRQSLQRAKHEKVDLFIGNHVGHNQTPERYKRLLSGDKLAFVDPDAWRTFLDKCEELFNKLEAGDPIQTA